MGRIDTYPTGQTIVPVTASLLAYAETTSAQTGISTETNLTGLSVNVTVPAGRRIKIYGQVQMQSATTSRTVILRIKEGATVIAVSQENYNTIGGNGKYLDITAVISPSNGAHTYNLSLQGVAGTIDTSAGVAHFIAVEDVTGSQLATTPAQFVPVGRLGYAERTSDQTGVTSRVPISPLSVNVSVPAGRVLRVKLHAGLSRTVADGVTRFFLVQDGSTIQFKDMFVRGALEGHVNVDFDVIVSPSAGAHTYSADIQQVTGTGTSSAAAGVGEPAFILVEDITPTPSPASGAPGSTLAYAEVTAGQIGISAATNLTGLSVTVTVPAGRRLRIVGKGQVANDANAGSALGEIMEGATVLGRWARNDLPASASTFSDEGGVIITPTAGSHTYNLRLTKNTGSGVVDFQATTNNPAYILVEDITGSVWPAGSSVTTGLIASEPWTDWVPTFTNFTLGNGTLTAKYIKIGRMVNWYMKVQLGTTSSMGTSPTFSLPVAMAASYNNAFLDIMGNGWIQDAGTAHFGAFVNWQTSSTVGLNAWSASGAFIQASGVTGTSPMTWTTSDSFTFTGNYEAAS